MSRIKKKLVLKVTKNSPNIFEISKSVNTVEFGVPHTILIREVVDRILIENRLSIQQGFLTVEFIS